MAKQKYRVISWILLVAMLLSLYPPGALAAGNDHPEAKIGEQTYATLKEAFSAAQKMTEWNSAPVSRENPVVIELEADVELNATLLVKKGSGARIEDATYHVRLEGNGHTIRRGAGCTENMIHVAISSTLILENVTLDGSGSTGPYNAAILYIGSTQSFPSWVNEITHDNYVELGKDAVLENNTNPRTGGAVNIEAGTFVLNGGTIRNNSAGQHGGGVYVGTGDQGHGNASSEYYPSKFIMIDGTISGNQVTGNYVYGGGVYVDSSNEPENNASGFVMRGGTIEGNHCAYYGGGIALSGSGIKFKDGADTGRTNLTLLGGTIQNNTEGSTRRPSGVYGMFASNVQLGGAVVISDGLYLTGYTVRKVPYGGKIDVVSDMTGASVALRFGNNSYYPAGQIVVDKAEDYTGDLDLSWFDWKWDNSGNLNTTEKLVYNEAGSALVVAQKYKITLQKDPAAGGTVGFADDSADGGDTARTYCEGDAVTIQAIPNKGYRFVQWMDEAESAVSTEAEYTLTVKKAETFTARFEAESYTVTLDPNGGTLDPEQDVKSYTYGTETPLPDGKAITRKGYTFAGWYDADEPSGGEVDAIPAEAVGNKTYRAKWLSADISVKQVELEGIAGEQNGLAFCITLPYGSTLPTAGDAFTIQTVHEGATVLLLVQDAEENSKWHFTVTAENGIEQQTYTIFVQIGENPAAENIAQLESLGEKLKASERWEISWADLSAEEQQLKEAFTARLEEELDEFLQTLGESNAVVQSVALAEVTAPVEGTSDDLEGIPGSFTMQIKLAKGEAETYAEKEITILGTLTVEPYRSADISVKQVKLEGITGEQNDLAFCITLPYGSTLPTAGNAFDIQTVHEGATVSLPVQDAEENSKWHFTVTAENGIEQQTYTVVVQIGENPAAENIAQLESLGEKLTESEHWTISWADLSEEEQLLKEAFTARLKAELDEFLKTVGESNAVVQSVTVAEVTAPVQGTSDDPEGTPGSFTMQLKLAKGEAETYAEKEITIQGTLTVEPYKPAEKPETPPEKDQETKGNTEAFIGAATVLAGGAAALIYYYREDLPIWQLSGVVELVAADGTISPAANATVILTSKNEVVRTLTTDTEGIFVARVPKGEYQVTVVWEQDGTTYNVQDTVTAETLLPDGTPQQILLAAPDTK